MKNKRIALALSLLSAAALVLGACATPTAVPATPQVIRETVEVPIQQTIEVPVQQTVQVQVTTTPRPVTVIRVAMGYIPNFQFAPFYVALEKGYFAEEGLQVILDGGTETDAVTLVSNGTNAFGISDGSTIILARSQGQSIKYVMRWYNGWPTAIFSLKDKNLTKPQDLVGKKVGLPGPFGANWTAWLALLDSQGIDPATIDVQMIGFTQAAAVSSGLVDAAAGYSVNEPVQLQSQGTEVNVILTDDYVNLAPIGIFASEEYIQDNPEIVQGFVRALLRGIKASVDDPAFTLEAVIRAVQFSGGNNRPGTQAGLQAVSKYWTSPGEYDPAVLQQTQDLMLRLKMIDATTSVDDMFTNEFVQGAGAP